MKLNLKTRLISAALTCAMLLTSPIGALNGKKNKTITFDQFVYY